AARAAVKGVGAWHVTDQLSHETRTIDLPPVRIARVQRIAKNVETHHRSSRARNASPVQWISGKVDYRRDARIPGAARRYFGVAVIHSRKESEDSLARGIGKHH